MNTEPTVRLEEFVGWSSATFFCFQAQASFCFPSRSRFRPGFMPFCSSSARFWHSGARLTILAMMPIWAARSSVCGPPEPWSRGIVRFQVKLFLMISGLSVVLFIYLVKNPLFLPLRNFLPAWLGTKARSRNQPPSQGKAHELDAILEKISRSGMSSLSREEKAVLDSASKKYKNGWG